MKQVLYERLIQYILEEQERFYRVAYSYTRHQEDALDVVQSAVCKALEAYESIKKRMRSSSRITSTFLLL